MDEILRQTPTDDTCDSVLVSEIASIIGIGLHSKKITSLQSGDFTGLPNVGTIDLRSNSLNELPAGIFSGLPLLSLALNLNPGAPFQLKVHLQVIAFGNPESFTAGSLRLVMPVGAPRTVTIPVTLAGATPPTGSLTVPTGGVESGALRFTRGEGDFQVRTGEITLGGVGSRYVGFDIVEGDRLDTITATAIRLRVFLEGALE